MSYRLDIVDVFATAAYTGNQLAVVSDCTGLTADEMRSIAGEMNYSETTFVESRNRGENRFSVRIFTPKMELPFAGHPTLGTAYVIRKRLLETNLDEVTLDLPIGPVPVTVEQMREGELYWMRQGSPNFQVEIDHETVATALGLDIDDLDTRYPVREVSTGLPVLIAPLKNLDAIRCARPDWDLYERHLGDLESESILVFGPETYHERNDLNVRVFSRRGNQSEDAATGSGNGCLACYLAVERYFETYPVTVRVEQGYEIGRPSLIHLQVDTPDGENVSVGGAVVPVARGKLL